MLTTFFSIEYNKKPGKLAVVKTMKDPAVPRDDLYKSSTVHTGPGEPPNSVSKPTPRPRQVAGKPISKGKLLRPGGPGGGPSKLASRPAEKVPTPQPMPQADLKPTPTPAAANSRPVPQTVDSLSSSHKRVESASSQTRAPPPPPPPPYSAAPAVKKDQAKALYDFISDRSNELSIHAGDTVQVMSREANGLSNPIPPVPHIQSFCLSLTHLHRLVVMHGSQDFCARLGTRSLP